MINRKLDITTAVRNFQFEASQIIIFYQDCFPTRLIFLTWFSLSLSVSMFVCWSANAVAESKDSVSLCIYIESVWLFVVLFPV